MDPLQIDFLAVTLSAILFFVIMAVWYSKWFFGSIWKGEGEKRCTMTVFLLSNFVIGFLIAYFIAFFQAYLSVSTVADGMFVGFSLWIGFVFPIQLLPLIWHKKSIRIFLVDTSAQLLAFLTMGGIIGA